MATSSRWSLAALAVCAACGGPASSESPGAHDPCAPLAITSAAADDVQRAGIAAALVLWQGRGVAAFDPAPATGAVIDVQFADAADAFHGVYDPAGDRVLINRDITDPATLSIVIAHELGHAFGLVHIPPATRISLMNPDNLISPPTDGDQRALEALWGSCR